MKLIIEDEVMKKLEPKMSECAELIKKNLHEGSPVIIRFNDDVDGITAGLAIYEGIMGYARTEGIKLAGGRVKTIQTSSPFYEKVELVHDLELRKQFSKKPLVIICDYGANEESVENLSKIKSAGFILVVIDHHPHAKEIKETADTFISPFLVGGNSDYSTGLLAVQIALELWEGVNKNLAWFSLQGDKSVFAKEKGFSFKEPVAIDYVANEVPKENNLGAYEKLLADKEALERNYEKAMNKIKWILDNCNRFSKVRNVEGVRVVVVKMGKLCKKGEYPSKGKGLNFISEQFIKKCNGALICIGYGDDTISIRANAEAYEKGFRSSRIIRKLRGEYGWAIKSGGGHEQAASIRMNESLVGKAVETILELTAEEITISKPPPEK
ncbi:MAG: hypothetical protein HZB67_05270 [Candidatus Aenigmarchaeota archaeon]|nr:hypothetical protein [Candidatus Aenigmarchaeota archaeon]MBI5228958.1 hypothetical protein [Candidatus Micrarchaeota archaeon]